MKCRWPNPLMRFRPLVMASAPSRSLICRFLIRIGSPLESPMMNSRSSMFKVVLLAMILQATALAQTHQQPVTANICEVVESPDGYNEKVLTVEGILLPSEHSLALYSPSQTKRGLQCDDPSGASTRLGVFTQWQATSKAPSSWEECKSHADWCVREWRLLLRA